MIRYSLLIAIISIGFAHAAFPLDVVSGIHGLDSQTAKSLEAGLPASLGKNPELSNRETSVLQDFLARAIFNGESPVRAAAFSNRVLKGLRSRVPAPELLEMSEMGLSQKLTDSQLYDGARSLRVAEEMDLPRETVYEVIRHGASEGWTGNMILEAIRGLGSALAKGLDVSKTALAIVIRFDTSPDHSSPKALVAEELAGLDKLRDYEAVKRAISRGVPAPLANEIYEIGRSDQWQRPELLGVLRGLEKAVKKGLTVDKVALALIVRIAQGLEVPIDRAVDEELVYVSSLPGEKRRKAVVAADPVLRNLLLHPRQPTRHSPASLNRDLLQNSILSFYNAPTRYQWGGNSRGQKGTDCSGFTSSCYREQGILIPRVSRDQFKRLQESNRTINKPDLAFGDLVFFNSNGSGRITHVGIYYGEGKFVHSCSSKGVTFTPLAARYYVTRYVGAGRVAD